MVGGPELLIIEESIFDVQKVLHQHTATAMHYCRTCFAPVYWLQSNMPFNVFRFDEPLVALIEYKPWAYWHDDSTAEVCAEARKFKHQVTEGARV